MKVALLSRAAFPLHAPGGMERAVHQLAKHLHERGVETLLLTRAPTRAGVFPGEVVSVPYGWLPLGGHGRILDRTLNYPAFALRLGAAAGALVRAGRVDVVHAHGLTALGYGRLRLKDGALRAPLLLNPHGMEEHKARGLKRLALARVRRLSREAARLSDRVIATDEGTRDEAPRYLGVDPSRVVVLPNAIDLAEIEAATPGDSEELVRQALPRLGEASPVLLSVGRLEGYKGFFDVLEALLSLEAAGRLPPRWAWIVVGEGSQGAELKARAAARGLLGAGDDALPHVHFAGLVSEPLLHACYARSDLFVHASHYEGSSLVTLEAMAHALPVVATRTGGIPDKVRSGEAGLLVEPRDVPALADAIASLASEPGRRRAMGAKGRGRVGELFGWDAVAGRTIALYEELLGKAGG